MATHTPITAGQFDRLPLEEGRRYELFDGELIEMPSANPKHNWILLKLGSGLMQFLEQTGWGVVLPDTEFVLVLRLSRRCASCRECLFVPRDLSA